MRRWVDQLRLERSGVTPQSKALTPEQQKIQELEAKVNRLEREKAIFQARRLRDEPATLEELAQEYNVSRERIRQIEVRAFEKVQEAVQKAARERAADRENA